MIVTEQSKVSSVVDFQITNHMMCRFERVSVPPQAEVISAFVQFQAASAASDGVTLTVAGEASASSSVLVQEVSYTLRSQTTNQVSWSPSAWVTGNNTMAQQSANIASIVSEIVATPGWRSGSNLTVVFRRAGTTSTTGSRIAQTGRTTGTQKPYLRVVYGPDSTPPTATITPASLSTNSLTTIFVVDFSEEVSSFSNSNVLLNANNTNAVVTQTTQDSLNLLRYRVTVSHGASNGVYSLTLVTGSSGLTDLNGNHLISSTSSVATIDTIPPTVQLTTAFSVNTQITQATTPFTITVTFSETVKSFAATDLIVSGASLVQLSSDGATVFTFLVTPIPQSVAQSLNVTVPSGFAPDLFDNRLAQSISLIWNNMDVRGPAVAIDSATISNNTFTTQNSASIAFTLDEVSSLIECSFNGTAFSTCASPLSFQDLVEGSYSVMIRAYDNLNNVGTTTAIYWTVYSPVQCTDGLTIPNSPTVCSGVTRDVCAYVCDYGYTAVGSHVCQSSLSFTGGSCVDITPPYVTSVSMISSNVAPTSARAGDVLTVLLSFSEIVSSSMIVQIAGRNSAIVGSGKPYNASITVQSNDVQGTVAVRMQSFADLAGNSGTNTTLTPTSSVAIDTVAPVPTFSALSTVTNGSLVRVTTASFTFSSNDANAIFQCALDQEQIASCTSPQQRSNLADGIHTFSINAVDAAGNIGSVTRTWTVDTIAPQLLVTSSGFTSAYITNADPLSFTFKCTEPCSGLRSTDISVTKCNVYSYVGNLCLLNSNTKSALTKATFSTSDTCTIVCTPSNGQVFATIAAGALIDDAGNPSLQQTTFSILSDRTSPIPTLQAAINGPTNQARNNISLTFDETILGFSVSQLVLSDGHTGAMIESVQANSNTAANTSWVVYISNATASGTYTVALKNPTSITDTAGNLARVVDPTTLAVVSVSVTIDLHQTAVLSTCLASSNPQSPRLAKLGDTITLDFSVQDTVSFPTISIFGRTASVIATNANGTAYRATAIVTGSDSEGVVPFSVSNYHNIAGNLGSEITIASSQCAVTIDNTTPVLSSVCLRATNELSNSIASPTTLITVTLAFSEAVVSSPNATVAGHSITSFIPASGNTIYSATFAMGSSAPEGWVTVTVSNFSDFSRNVQSQQYNVVNTDTSCGVFLDSTAPVVTISVANGVQVSNNQTLTFTVSFSESIRNSGNITSILSFASCSQPLASQTGNLEYQVTCPANNGQTVSVSAILGAVADIAGNTNTQAAGASVLSDLDSPTVTSIIATRASPTNAASNTFNITFSEAVQGLTVNDLQFDAGTTGATFSIIQPTLLPTSVWQISVSGAQLEGTYSLTVTGLGGTAVDAAHNVLNAVSSPVASVSVDLMAPTATISTPTALISSSTITLTLESSELLTGLRASDILITTFTGQSCTVNVSAISTVVPNLRWSVELSNFTSDGLFNVSISPTASTTDAAGNRLVCNQPLTFQVDRSAPVLVSVCLSSSNANSSVARAADNVTITVISSIADTISTPTIHATSRSVQLPVTTSGDGTFTATYMVTDSDVSGPFSFSVGSYTDAAGNVGATVSSIIAGSNSNCKLVMLDLTPPTIEVCPTSTNPLDPSVVRNGVAITFAISASELISLPSLKVFGQLVALTALNSNALNPSLATNFSGTYTETAQPARSDGPITFQVYGYNDGAGNSGVSTTAAKSSCGVTLGLELSHSFHEFYFILFYFLLSSISCKFVQSE
jgi:methionine-rich copper-binding protein CopC